MLRLLFFNALFNFLWFNDNLAVRWLSVVLSRGTHQLSMTRRASTIKDANISQQGRLQVLRENKRNLFCTLYLNKNFHFRIINKLIE
jgi:hypothetical protein